MKSTSSATNTNSIVNARYFSHNYWVSADSPSVYSSSDHEDLVHSLQSAGQYTLVPITDSEVNYLTDIEQLAQVPELGRWLASKYCGMISRAQLKKGTKYYSNINVHPSFQTNEPPQTPVMHRVGVWNWLEEIGLPPASWFVRDDNNNSYWTVDRIDSTKDYSPGNIRWLSAANNQKFALSRGFWFGDVCVPLADIRLAIYPTSMQ